MDYLKYLIIILLLVSCKTTKKTEEFKTTHFEASELVAQNVDLTYKVITESRKGFKVIRIYDTSKAKETEDGFVSPLAMEITERDTIDSKIIDDKLVIQEQRSKDSIRNDTQYEKSSKKTKKGMISNSLIVFLVGVFFIIILKKGKRIFQVL